jgi:DNA invertase Pin-like site-specific DNA recombinase
VKRVIELIRVSTAEQADDAHASIPAQRSANQRTAASYGLTIARSIEITDVSGTAVLRSPEMQELLRLIESPEIHGVVVREFSRIMRPDNFGDYVLFKAFQDTGTLLYLPDGPLDLNSKTGKLVAGLRAMIAGNELSEIRERVWSAKEEMRRSGKNPQSNVCLPFGVAYTREQGFFYKPEAEQVREAFRRLLSGETSYTELGKMVGVTAQGMHTILANPIWMGWRVIDKKRDMSTAGKRFRADGRQGDRRKIRREGDDIIRVKVIQEPLLSDDEFERSQRIISAKTRLHWHHRSGTKHQFTYAGFLQCAVCKSTIYGKDASGLYYVCRRRFWHNEGKCMTPYMRRDRLEQKLDGIISTRLTDRDFIAGLLRAIEARSTTADTQKRGARLQNEVLHLDQKKARVLDAYVEGLLTREDRDVRLKAIYEKMRTTTELLHREVSAAPTTVSIESLMVAFAPLFEWAFLSREHKRRILAVTIPEIHVSNYRVTGVSVSPAVRGVSGNRSQASLRGYSESRVRAASLIATISDPVFLPLNL